MRHPLTQPDQPTLQHLRDLPFVDDLELRLDAPADPGAPGAVREAHQVAMRVGHRWHVFQLALVTRPLDEIQVDHLRNKAVHQPARPLLVMARRVPRVHRDRLRQAGIAYVDAAGNCFLQLGREHVAWIDGRRAPADGLLAPRTRGLGATGYQVEFALLAEPLILNRPVREIAETAGVGKTAVADLLARLLTQGIIVERGGERRLVDRQGLLDDWLGGQARLLRPRHLFGRFEAHDAADPDGLEARLRTALLGREEPWAFGGGIAAKHWTGHWRGELTVLHVAHPTDDLPRHLRLLPARKGRVHVFRAPCRAAINTQTHLAHPLLVYAELMAEGHERAREAALEVRRQFPEHFA